MKREKNPRAEEAKRLITDYGAGKRLADRDVCSRTLNPSEYTQLLAVLEDDETLNAIFVDDVRHDYTVDNRRKNNKRLGQFVVWIPTTFHELLSEKIEDAIKDWRENDWETHGVSHRLYLETRAENDKKDPNLSYKYEDENEELEYQELVLEVGWSEKSDELEKKCKLYIE
ncbi:hypothetical protein F4860DRAFT_528891 [Xylaria cubensis]|nr:hypothetical protein F4860DRAFT_528891 [Xylaria cubensis]